MHTKSFQPDLYNHFIVTPLFSGMLLKGLGIALFFPFSMSCARYDKGSITKPENSAKEGFITCLAFYVINSRLFMTAKLKEICVRLTSTMDK
jgi:hypothetical protein